MIANGYFDHFSNGGTTSPFQRITAAGYSPIFMQVKILLYQLQQILVD